MALRGRAEILMGKNTLIRKALRGLSAENQDIAKLMHVVRGNVGFVFTKGDLVEIRDVLHSFKVRFLAAARSSWPFLWDLPWVYSRSLTFPTLLRIRSRVPNPHSSAIAVSPRYACILCLATVRSQVRFTQF